MIDFRTTLRLLSEHGVSFILCGGAAAIVHGSSRLTRDLDIVYARTPENLTRLVGALAEQAPYPRGAPAGLPFRWSEVTLRNGLNFTLETRLGPLDLLGELAGGGGYEALIGHTVEVELFGVRCRSLDLPTLIMVKRAAGRPRDLDAVAELESIMMERGRDTE